MSLCFISGTPVLCCRVMMQQHWSECDIEVKGTITGRCAVIGCKNSFFRIKKWLKQECSVHPGYKHNSGCCICDPPFVLWLFPKEGTEYFDEWKKYINRKAWFIEM